MVKQAILRPAGYTELIERYDLDVIPNWHTSRVTTSGIHRIDSTDGITEEIYPPTHWPGEELGDHLEFALKYDGTNLAILASLFQVVDTDQLVVYIRSKPTGKFTRRLWFLYELLTRRKLPLSDVGRGNYVDLLDPKRYYVTSPARKVQRQRINDNLLGDHRFCPTIRRTDTLRDFDAANLSDRTRNTLSAHSPTLLKRAMSYLYTKETRSSFEIENIDPGSSRTERFVALLQLAEKKDFCEKERLIDLQTRIVDPRFSDTDYRTKQNYIGETVDLRHQRVHFVCPKPEDVEELMGGLIASHDRMGRCEVHPVIHAAAVAFGFVFIHPFEDGNGRIHRFLIHNVLARREFSPAGVIFPVSASMLKHPAEYDESLEAFSRPLMRLVEYSLDGDGNMVVENEMARFYRYIDLTAQAEALFRFIENTIDTEFVEELAFLNKFDRTKSAIQEIVDMPDLHIDHFIKSCLQNNGRLSARKRGRLFESLSDDEVTRIEHAVQSGWALDGYQG